MSKLCTVIIPTHNRPQSLRLAVQSALDALPPNSEIIVVDDGSTQKACDTLHDMRSDFVLIVENSPPHGPSQARNLGVRLAQGRTIFFLDDDDEFLPHYLKEITHLRESLPDNCMYGFSSALRKTEQGSEPFKIKHRSGGVYDKDVTLSNRLAGLGMGFWVDRNAILKLGGLDERLRVNEDTEFCIRLASQGYICYKSMAPGIVLTGDELRPQGDKGSITKLSTSLSRATGFEHILRRHNEFLLSNKRLRQKYLIRIMKYRWRAGNIMGWDQFLAEVSAGKMERLAGMIFGKLVQLRTPPSH